MTQEEKQLLIKDLCARLPYGVIVRGAFAQKNNPDAIYTIGGYYPIINNEFYLNEVEGWVPANSIKPYLRPMSSMTDEEKSIMDSLWKENNKLVFADPDSIRRYRFYDISVVDFLNKRHLDYRGLIEKGLALKAPEGMYKLNKI